MNSPQSSDTAPHRPRFGLLAVFVALAFIIGIALMLVAMRNSGGWLVHTPPSGPPEAAAPRSATLNGPLPLAQPAALPPSAPAVAPGDSDAIETRVTALAARLAALEARAAAIDSTAAAAGAQAGRAEAMMVAFATRRALDRGLPLGYLEVQLRERFGQGAPAAVTLLIAAARQPVTLAALRQALDASADLLVSGGDGWLAGVRHQLGSLIILRDAGTPSPLASARLARAGRLLDAGQVEAALAEVDRLPGATRTSNWAIAARRYIEAHRALDAIEASALMLPPAARHPAPAEAAPSGPAAIAAAVTAP